MRMNIEWMHILYITVYISAHSFELQLRLATVEIGMQSQQMALGWQRFVDVAMDGLQEAGRT